MPETEGMNYISNFEDRRRSNENTINNPEPINNTLISENRRASHENVDFIYFEVIERIEALGIEDYLDSTEKREKLVGGVLNAVNGINESLAAIEDSETVVDEDTRELCADQLQDLVEVIKESVPLAGLITREDLTHELDFHGRLGEEFPNNSPIPEDNLTLENFHRYTTKLLTLTSSFVLLSKEVSYENIRNGGKGELPETIKKPLISLMEYTQIVGRLYQDILQKHEITKGFSSGLNELIQQLFEKPEEVSSLI